MFLAYSSPVIIFILGMEPCRRLTFCPTPGHGHALWCVLFDLRCRLFEFVMRMLATGSNCLPAGGIGALSQQLASSLPPDSIYTGVTAANLSQKA
jgi:hypothetical protein